MKNQNDLIIMIVVGVLAIGLSIFFFTQARVAQIPPAPTTVPTSPVALPPGTVVHTNGLAGGSAAAGAPAGGGAFEPRGIPGGPPPGIPRGGARRGFGE